MERTCDGTVKEQLFSEESLFASPDENLLVTRKAKQPLSAKSDCKSEEEEIAYVGQERRRKLREKRKKRQKTREKLTRPKKQRSSSVDSESLSDIENEPSGSRKYSLNQKRRRHSDEDIERRPGKSRKTEKPGTKRDEGHRWEENWKREGSTYFGDGVRRDRDITERPELQTLRPLDECKDKMIWLSGERYEKEKLDRERLQRELDRLLNAKQVVPPILPGIQQTGMPHAMEGIGHQRNEGSMATQTINMYHQMERRPTPKISLSRTD